MWRSDYDATQVPVHSDALGLAVGGHQDSHLRRPPLPSDELRYFLRRQSDGTLEPEHHSSVRRYLPGTETFQSRGCPLLKSCQRGRSADVLRRVSRPLLCEAFSSRPPNDTATSTPSIGVGTPCEQTRECPDQRQHGGCDDQSSPDRGMFHVCSGNLEAER